MASLWDFPTQLRQLMGRPSPLDKPAPRP